MAKHPKPIRVLLVDDHPLFRDGLTSLLEKDERFQIVGEAENGEAAIVAAARLAPDVVLMDIQMPGIGGLEATRRLLATQPSLKVIMLTVSDKDDDLFEAIKAGAQGYLLKTVTGARELADAIVRIAAGEAIVTPALAPRLLAEFAALARERERGRTGEYRGKEVEEQGTEEAGVQGSERAEAQGAELEVLTRREREVLELVAEGLTNKEIAARLVISENTVRAHLRRILDKLHVNSRVQAAVWLRQQRVD